MKAVRRAVDRRLAGLANVRGGAKHSIDAIGVIATQMHIAQLAQLRQPMA